MNRKNNIIKPKGLKGKETLNRALELMNITPIKESVNPSVVELTKKGPDGKVYGIVRENKEYYIKVTNKQRNIISEDFKYIGGLQNKKDKSYPSYSKAIKMLNLKFISINEALAQEGKVDTFTNDNLLTEHHNMKPEAKLSPNKSFGDNSEYVVDKKGEKLDYDAKEGDEEDGFGDNVAKSTAEKDIENVKLSENEEAIDRMINGEEVINEGKKGFSIARAIQEMDEVIDSINPNSEIEGILSKLNESEKSTLLKVLKKKR